MCCTYSWTTTYHPVNNNNNKIVNSCNNAYIQLIHVLLYCNIISSIERDRESGQQNNK